MLKLGFLKGIWMNKNTIIDKLLKRLPKMCIKEVFRQKSSHKQIMMIQKHNQ